MYIITGGLGFIGSNLVEELTLKKEEFLIIDNLYSKRKVDKKTKFMLADVSRREEIEFLERLKGEEVNIIHLAAVVGVDEARLYPNIAFDYNVKGTQNILEIARKLDAYITIASSAAIYGEKTNPIREEDEKEPINFYGFTKLMSESLLSSYIKEYGIKGSALRLFNVYGPKMKGGPYAGVIQIFIEKLLKNERPTIHGDGKNTRDFIYVKDVVNAFLSSVKIKATGFYNIGTGKETSIKELLDLIEKILNVKIEPIYDEPRKNDIKRSVAIIDKARKELNWSPGIDLETGLKNTINYLKKEII